MDALWALQAQKKGKVSADDQGAGKRGATTGDKL